MIDAIVYVEDFMSLVAYLAINYPEYLKRQENGSLVYPPVVIGFARTKAIVNGNSLLSYFRLSFEEAEMWRNTPGVEILAESNYIGMETCHLVYDQVFNDPTAKAKYDSVYDYTPYDVDDGLGGTITIYPPERFGCIA